MDDAMLTIFKQVVPVVAAALIPALTQGARIFFRRRGYRAGSDSFSMLEELNVVALKACPLVEVDKDSLLTREDYYYRRNRILVITKMAEREPYLAGRSVTPGLLKSPADGTTPDGHWRRSLARWAAVGLAILAIVVGMLLYMQIWRLELLLPLVYMFLGFLIMTLAVEVVDAREGTRMFAFLVYAPLSLLMLVRSQPQLTSDGWSMDPTSVILLVAFVVVAFVFVMYIRSISVDDALRECGGLTEPLSVAQCELAAQRAHRKRLALVEGMLLYLVGVLMLAVLVMAAGASR